MLNLDWAMDPSSVPICFLHVERASPAGRVDTGMFFISDVLILKVAVLSRHCQHMFDSQIRFIFECGSLPIWIAALFERSRC